MEHQTEMTFCPICNREYRVHCPECGSYRHYALVSRQDRISRTNGDVILLKVYRCMSCGATYNDDQWQFHCHAQPKRGRGPAREKREPVKSSRLVFDSPFDAPFETAREVLKYGKQIGYDMSEFETDNDESKKDENK